MAIKISAFPGTPFLPGASLLQDNDQRFRRRAVADYRRRAVQALRCGEPDMAKVETAEVVRLFLGADGGGLSDGPERVQGLLNALGTEVRGISDLAMVIHDLAGQTSLMGLSLTMEAALSGDVSEGFAVIASDLGRLSDTIARATEAISQRLEGIHADAEGLRAELSAPGTPRAGASTPA